MDNRSKLNDLTVEDFEDMVDPNAAEVLSTMGLYYVKDGQIIFTKE